MSAADTARRFAVFAAVFAAAMGLVVWSTGALRDGDGDGEPPPRETSDAEGASQPAPSGDVASVGDGLGLGRSEGGTLSRDATVVIDGKPVPYRAWTAEWDRSAPRPGEDPERSVQDVEGCRLVLFPRPDGTEVPLARADAPGATEVTSRRGVLEHQPGVGLDAQLRQDVVVTHHTEGHGALHLRTQALDCRVAAGRKGDERKAQSAERVVIEGGGTQLEGVGIDADFAERTFQATLHREVRGHFLARRGEMTGQGASDTAPQEPVDVTCTGAATIVALEAKGASKDRWRATFHDEVRVTQGGTSLHCDLLELEFRMGDPRAQGSRVQVDRLVATGHVLMRGAEDGRDIAVDTERATRTFEPGGEEVVVCEGATVMTFAGRLRDPREKGGPAADPSRIEVRSSAGATLRARPVPKEPGARRVNVVFEKDVVAKQWNPVTGVVESELRAPKATLYGNRGTDGRFAPDTLTAEGGVELRRQDLVATGRTVTWAVVSDQRMDLIRLSGKPQVTLTGAKGQDPFGGGRDEREGRLVLNSDEEVEIRLWQDEQDRKAGKPLAQISATRNVVVRRFLGDHEAYRMTSETGDAVIGADRELEILRAYGGAKLVGFGEGPDAKTAEVSGSRLQVVLGKVPEGSPAGTPRPATATVFGDDRTPAVAIVREPGGRRHELRAPELRYEQGGSVLVAQRGAEAVLNVAEGAAAAPAGKLSDGKITVQAVEMRAELRPAADQSSSSRARLKRLVATDRVALNGAVHRLTGDTVTYDAESGRAEAIGRPAIVTRRDVPGFPSFANGEVIRAFFGTSPDNEGQLLRASIPQGGRIVRYLGRGDDPQRVQVQASGPIEIERAEATALRDVIVVQESKDAKGQWQRDARMDSERLRMVFDMEAKGEAQDRVSRMEATGTDELPVRVETPKFTATAQRVTVTSADSQLHIDSAGGPQCYVNEIGTQRRFYCDSVDWNYKTYEWSNWQRPVQVE